MKISRRALMLYCSTMAMMLSKPLQAAGVIADAVEKADPVPVIWLSLQGCQGCTVAALRASTPPLEDLLLKEITLGYHLSLQTATGEEALMVQREMAANHAGRYFLIVEGSIPQSQPGYAMIGGRGMKQTLVELAEHAAVIVALGSCAAFGGVVGAWPNPTGAVAIDQLLPERPLVNLPGCPPIPAVISGVILHYLAWRSLPELDVLGRPKAFYDETVHERCYRRPYFERGQLADNFDDEGARQGWCLFALGCKGPTTHSSCASIKWNQGVSFPIQSGHGCISCAEPGGWDAGGLYRPLANTVTPVEQVAGVGLALGVMAGAAVALGNRRHCRQARRRLTAVVGEKEEQS